MYPEVLSVRGINQWEGGIIHRLDTPTSGIVLAALNNETYSHLISLQKKDLIKKCYIAYVSERKSLLPGFEPCPYILSRDAFDCTSYFRTYGERGASVRPVLENSRNIKGEKYTTRINYDGNKAECIITRGFRHQIRSHLSWLGIPIIGDNLYGGAENEELLLEAVEVSFPFKGRTVTITLPETMKN